MKRLVAVFVAVLVCAAILAGCQKKAEEKRESGRLRMVTTLFPLYDFARNVAGDKAEVTLLLPPGMEPHSFEPRPEDVVRINKADLFIFTNRAMEPWAADIAKGAGGSATLVVDASRGVKFLKGGEGHGHGRHGHDEKGGEHEGEGMDPHIWLDFANAQIMVDNIAAALSAKDPASRAFYVGNAEAYKAKLADLDSRYRQGLVGCAKRVFLHGGHFAFGYLANRYGLRYESAFGASADAEPTPARIASLVKRMRSEGLKYIYTEELIDPRMAGTIAAETGATILKLHGAHNIGRDELARGETFLSLMEKNLTNLRTGLQCM